MILVAGIATDFTEGASFREVAARYHITAELARALWEAAVAGDSLYTVSVCAKCNGSGTKDEERCAACRGSGMGAAS